MSFRVTPFSFVEYCEIKQIAEPSEEELLEYMNWGGMPQRFSMIKSVNRMVSAQTLYNYLDHIQSSLIVSKAQRYDIRGKQLLTTLDKYFLTDLGLGRIHNSGYKLEIGAMLENIVYNELRNRDYEVYVGKIPGGEVDFVAVKGDQREYYQVAYYLTDQSVIDREFDAFKAISDNYPKYVISMDKADFSRDGILHKNVIKFLVENVGV